METPRYYDVDDEVKLDGLFEKDGVGTYPAAAEAKVLEPDKTIVTVAAAQVAGTPGLMRAVFTCAKPGDHWWSMSGTAPAKAYEEHWFVVRPKRVSA